jgi:ABC-type branched-subunit amino acid transport system substrate-binding protein
VGTGARSESLAGERSSRRARRFAFVIVLLLLGTSCAQRPSVPFNVRAVSFPTPAAVAAPSVSGARPSSGGLIGSPGSGGVPIPGSVAGAGSHTTITLGTVLPLQGGQRNWGEPVLRTTQAFVDETNASGGINGHPLKLIAYNACLTCQDEALQAVRRLVEQDHVFAIVNTYVEVVAFQSVIDYLAKAGVPLIQGAAESQTSAALSPVNFVTAPSGLFWARELPQMVKRFTTATKIGLTYVDVPTETNGLKYLRPEFARAGITIVDEEKVAAEEDAVTNMDSIVTRMRARGAQAIVSTNPVLLVYGRLAASRQSWNAKWVGLAAWSKLVTDACGHTCDDSLITETAGLSFINRDTPQMKQYRAVLARRYPGGEVTGLTLGAWVGMQLTSYVLARTGPDRQAFLHAMESISDLDLGTTAPLTFGPDRHMGATADMIIGLHNGEYVPIAGPVNYGEASP